MITWVVPIASDVYRWIKQRWVVLVTIGCIGIWAIVVSWPDQGRLTLVFCDAGQGDEILIQKGFHQILVDGSRPGQALSCLERHLPLGDRTLDVIVVSHPQLDHYGGLTDVLERYQVNNFVYNGYSSNSRDWKSLSAKVYQSKIDPKIVSSGDELRMDGVVLRVLWPPNSPEDGDHLQEDQLPNSVLGIADYAGNLNEVALVLVLRYGEFVTLLTSDIGQDQEAELLAGRGGNHLERASVLKVAHHGSRYSSSTPFLEAVSPRLAVIEVGKNSYGHPSPETIHRLQAVGARVLRTDTDGDVVVNTDGRRWRVKEETEK